MNSAGDIYSSLIFPEAPATRPHVFINMVATIDGKTIAGDRGEDVMDLGSKVDHTLMRRIEDQADAVIVGATTLRAASNKWDPGTPIRVVVSNTGKFDYSLPYFRSGGKAFVACAETSPADPEGGVERLEAGKQEFDLALLLARLKDMGVRKLLCMGGSELNAQLLERDLVDELFLSIAPKIKLGRGLPTYAGGEPLPREQIKQFELSEHHVVGDEVFLRYRRAR